jgi:hypothetical protein
MDDKSFNIRVPKKWARVGMIAVVTAMIVAPVTAWAAHSFNDVPNSNTFHEDIAWLKDAGVTLGCNPPTNTLFCPKDNVTREQMSAFMRRLAENKVVDAATAVQADDASTLDGNDSSDFVQKGEADSVTAGMTTNEPGVAQTVNGGDVVVDNVGLEQVAAVTITAPSAGYVVVHATSDAFGSKGAGTAMGLDAYGVSNNATALANDQDKDWIIGANGGTGTWATNMAAHKVFPVNAGANTFYLLATAWSATNVSVADTQLTATFVASAYGTVESSASSSGVSEVDN